MTLGQVTSIGLPIFALAMIGIVGVVFWRRRTRHQTQAPAPIACVDDPGTPCPTRAELRSEALDAVAQAVLVVSPDDQVLEANQAARVMFALGDEPRLSSELRTLESGHVDARGAAESLGAWSGESWVRHPDGAVRLCLTRIVPLRDAAGAVVAFAESYRDAVAEGLLADELRDRLYGIRQGVDDMRSIPEQDAVREELARLGAAFRDFELALRHYERLLPVISAHDPLAETIAGAAHDATSVVTPLRVHELLHDVPRTLARLHAATEELAHRAGQVDPAERI
jgi:hypothetical protein